MLKSLVVLPLLYTCALAESLDYSALTTEKLIDELARIDKPAPGIAGLGIYDAFIADDRPPRFAGGVLGVRLPDVPPQMRELVRRGPKALPLLIEHLSDSRPTQLAIGDDPNFHFMFQHYDSEYDPRRRSERERRHLLLGFGSGKDQGFAGAYSVKIADICYVLIGQIVNRRLIAVRYQPTGGLVVNSPIQSPILAEKVKSDWRPLNAKAHEASLLKDLRADNDPQSKAGIVRLRYYYPSRYRHLQGVDLAKRQEFEADELGYAERANEYRRQRQYSAAAKEWTKWIRHAPKSARGYHQRGYEYDAAGQASKALRDYSRAIKLEKRRNILDILFQYRARTYEVLGLYARARSDRRAAIENYKEIVRKNPDDSEYRILGTRYEADGQYKLSLKQYNRAIEMDPKDAFAYLNRANLHQKSGNTSAALADYQKILAMDPLNPGIALAARAKMFMTMGRLQEALADITAATTPNSNFPSDPPYLPYIDTRARIYLAMNKPQEAIADFTRVIDAGAGELSTYFSRGSAYERIGSLDLAIADYKKCLTEPARDRARLKMQRKARIRLKILSS